jgi:crotonobetainyl-CoA:carnitine CoA-transferase CaiB-like acyl-CoA transferase
VFMPTSAYTTSDGYLNLSAPGALWKRLCEAMGRPDLLERPEFRTGQDRSKNREALKDELNATFGRRSTAEWIEMLNAAGVPCGPIYDIAQAFDDPQVRHLEAAAEVRHPQLGTIRIVNQAVKLTRTPASMARATPEKGEHTEEVLKEYGFTDGDIARLRSQQAI